MPPGAPSMISANRSPRGCRSCWPITRRTPRRPPRHKPGDRAMVKIAAGRADAFARKPDINIRAVLVYGPDSGLVRERAEALVKAAAGSLDDPFRTREVTLADLKDD